MQTLSLPTLTVGATSFQRQHSVKEQALLLTQTAQLVLETEVWVYQPHGPGMTV